MKVVDECSVIKAELRPAPWFLSSRLGLAFISFFVLMSMTSQRASMYVAIPCMVNQSAVDAERGIIVINGSRIIPTTPAPFKKAISQKSLRTQKKCNVSATVLSPEFNLAPVNDGEFVWTEDQQTVVYRTFYWGYLVAQVPAGWFACRFGSRKILAGFLMLGSLSTVMVPLSTSVHYFILLVVRFVGGIGAGAVFPSIIALWAKWAPPGERTRLLTISFSGSTLGLVLSYPVAGFLCRYGFDGGWRSIFYAFGGLGCIASVTWFMFVCDSPVTHRRISKQEKVYIVTSLSGETDIEPNKKFHVPWWNFLTSLPFLSLVVCHFTCEWALYTFETKVPLFMKTIVKIDVQKDPVMWLLPYIGLWLVVLICGVWADKLRTRAVVSTSVVRKLMQCIGTLAPAAFLVALGFLDCTNIAAAVGIDILGIAFIGFQYSGFLVNHLDIYPKYAGVAIGLCNSIGAVSELVAPRLIDVVMDTKEQHEWQMIFFITAAFLGFSALSFALCGTGDLQPWAACQEYDLEDLNSNNNESSSDYGTNDATSASSDDSSDIISGEQKKFPNRRKPSNDLNKREVGKGLEYGYRRSKQEKESDVAEYVTATPPPAPDSPVFAGSSPPPSMLLPPLNPEDSSLSLTRYDDVANALALYDTLPARGRDRSVSPAPEKEGFQPYLPSSPPSPFPLLDYSLPHSIAFEEPYDSVFGSTSPYSIRSRHASPAFSESYASLEQPPGPGLGNGPLLSRRPSRGQASPQVPPRTSLTGLEVSPRQRSLTPTTFPQPESTHKRPSVDSSTAFEHLEESIV